MIATDSDDRAFGDAPVRTASGCVVGPDGREEPITEAMIRLALARIERNDISLHGNGHWRSCHG